MCIPVHLFIVYLFSVNRLRDHWDETSQSVLQRKSQLSTMLGDSQRLVTLVLQV